MSINVTVTGNPISIQKGKMVTASPNHSRKEFEKRRLIRISQVRQQSKNIAEEIRNKVKRQKLKQIEDIEKEGRKKLKQWQAKKLLELQNQCHEALKDIGAGHKETSLFDDEQNILWEKKRNDDETAKRRAEIAMKKIQEMKEKSEQNDLARLLRKKSIREIENKRSQTISNLNKSSESIGHKSSDKIINNPEVSGIVTEPDSYHNNIEVNVNKTGKEDVNIEIVDVPESSNDITPTTPTKVHINVEKSSVEDASDNDDRLLEKLRESKDTRISDQIKKRNSHKLSQQDPCDTLCNSRKNGETSRIEAVDSRSNMFSSIQQNIYACPCSKKSPVIRTVSPSSARSVCRPKKPVVSDINSIKCFDTTDDDESLKKVRNTPKSNRQKAGYIAPPPTFTPRRKGPIKEIPMRPKVTLKSVKSPIRTVAESISRDSLRKKSSMSRFSASHVERIKEDSLIISPEMTNNDEFFDKMRQRDREAMLRGQKALEKERLQREYNEMMKKLPVLQKLERLSEINQDKPEYHMTEERLREKERRRQNILDNTYEKLFPDKRPVTIPVKNNQNLTVKDKEILVDEDNPLNLSTWEPEKKSKKLYTEEEVVAMLKEGKIPSDGKFRAEQLKSILEKLRKQKEEILKEIQSQNLADVTAFIDISKAERKKDGNSSESPKSNSKTKKKEKEYVSVKVGTNSLSSSSSYETIEEVVSKPKSSKRASESKAVQATRGSKSTSKKKMPEVKDQKKKKEVPSACDDVKTSKSKETVKKSKDISDNNRGHEEKDKSNKEAIKMRGERDRPVTPSAPVNSLVSLDNERTKTSCDCVKEDSKKELCEIVIKIKEGKSSEVKVNNSGKDKVDAVFVEKPKKTDSNRDSTTSRTKEIKAAMRDDCCRDKLESWHQRFAKNNSQISTSSTSYMSPPQVVKKSQEIPKPAPYFSDVIGKKPQQLNFKKPAEPPKELPQTSTLGEIQRLLAMSRQSVEELGISSVSTVTTPSQSIINIDSNRIEKSNLTDLTNVNLNIENTSPPNFSFLTISSESRTVVASEIDSSAPYPDVVAKYARIADQCSQRISDLTSMIEKVREDKNKMLQTSSLLPNNDCSTKYMDLPVSEKSKESSKEQKSLSSSSSGDSKLLDINFSLAEKLKGMTSEEIKNFGRESKTDDVVDDSKGEELVKRFLALKEAPSSNSTEEVESRTTKIQHNVVSDALPKSSGSTDFIPLLLDIPKMPALAVDTSNNKHKKPPPSKSFLAALKFTDFAVPHELSTIPEQDSQLRLENITRDRSPKQQILEVFPTPNKTPTLESKSNKNLKRDDNKSNNKVKSKEKGFKPPAAGNTSSPIVNQSRDSSKTKDSDSSLVSNTSSDEKMEMLRIEAMLRSIGMDWAISTLRKTHEALALTSSSSSIDLKSPATLKHLSDADIEQYLSKQILQKISSSTLRTDASPGSLNESNELSDIHHSGFGYNHASTPMNRSRDLRKINERSTDPPSVLSDKMSNDFFSLPEHST